ncbi:lipopolysaccharide biosynthesis protein [Parahaliea aestuarii]|uniref:Lipopolysaccharide biosynthesis protein n=1 Tax=Parahaliea aestuarii TaxID=1852021 RepID=A0A5C9A431_9GAMM|nr:lipopolysaccharide biosynthesis protein [Parahaliea aestuarii]TXS94530.1 lipopolysaccharide biosynthesis protein [Parahaliea aestuarii]
MDVQSIFRMLLPKSSFLRGVTYLMGGSIGAHLLVFLVSPLLTRIYSPAELGSFALLAGIIAVPALIASFRYELAIPLPESNSDALSLALLSTLLVGVTGMLATLVIAVCFALDLHSNWPLPLQEYVWLVPIGVCLGGLLNVVSNYSVRHKLYSRVASSQIKQTLASIFVQFAGYSLGTLALMAAQFANQVVGLLFLGREFIARLYEERPTFVDIKRVAVRYSAFPFHATIASMLNVLSQHLPAFILSMNFGIAAAGLYALVYRVLAVPSSMLSSAVSRVFLSQLPEASREGRSAAFVLHGSDFLLNFSLPPVILMAILAPDIFGIIFGHEWEESGRLAQWLLLSVLFSFNVSPVSTVLYVEDRQRLNTVLQGFLFTVRLAGLLAGSIIGDAVTAIALYSIASALGYGMYLVAIFRLSAVRLGDYFEKASVVCLWTLFLLSPLLMAKYLGADDFSMALFALLACFSISARLLVVLKRFSSMH